MANINLTEAAAEKVKRALQARGAKGLRVAARQQDGQFAYELELEVSPKSDDLIVEDRDISVYLDPESAKLLEEGFEIDYVESEQGFLLHRLGTCGCGPDCECCK